MFDALRGLQGPVLTDDTICPGATSGQGTFEMFGDLVGCLYTDTIFPGTGASERHRNVHSTVHRLRALHWVHRCGSRWMRPTRSARHFRRQVVHVHRHVLDGGGQSGCRRALPSPDHVRTEDFSNAKGVINFVDIVTNGTADYQGRISLGDESG